MTLEPVAQQEPEPEDIARWREGLYRERLNLDMDRARNARMRDLSAQFHGRKPVQPKLPGLCKIIDWGVD